MFKNEDLFQTMKFSNEQIKEKRLKLTDPILEHIHHKLTMMLQDINIMTNKLMKKGCQLYDKLVEVSEDHLRHSENIE